MGGTAANATDPALRTIDEIFSLHQVTSFMCGMIFCVFTNILGGGN
jgi:hypothetical protein